MSGGRAGARLRGWREDAAGPLVPTTMDKPQTALVTGAAGFIGAAVTRRLLGAGARVIAVDDLSAGDLARLEGLPGDLLEVVQGDASDPVLLGRLLSSAPEVVIHLAGRVGVRTVLSDPELCERENVQLGAAVASAIARHSSVGARPRVLAASTSEVYAESAAPLSESSSLRARAASGRWRYAASKLACEAAFDEVLGVDGPRPVHLRFFNVVGPGQDGSSGMVLPRFVEAARASAPLTIHGGGGSVRTFAHVEAVARDIAALALPDLFCGGAEAARLAVVEGPLNLGGTARATVLELAQEVALAATRRGLAPSPLEHVDPRVTISPRFDEVLHRVPDLTRLQGLGLGLAPWSLADIVEDTFARHATPGASLAGKPLCASPAS